MYGLFHVKDRSMGTRSVKLVSGNLVGQDVPCSGMQKQSPQVAKGALSSGAPNIKPRNSCKNLSTNKKIDASIVSVSGKGGRRLGSNLLGVPFVFDTTAFELQYYTWLIKKSQAACSST